MSNYNIHVYMFMCIYIYTYYITQKMSRMPTVLILRATGTQVTCGNYCGLTGKYCLVGGFNPSEKYEFVNGKDYPMYEMENNKCLKPPTSCSYPSTLRITGPPVAWN